MSTIERSLTLFIEEQGDLEKRNNFKLVEYDGWGRADKGQVAYQRRDCMIIFTATRSSLESPSTVNAAEDVVIAICEAEGIDWKNPEFYQKFEFYDVSTPVGYPGRLTHPLLRGLPEVQIDKLHISPRPKNDYLHVDSWEPVNLESSENH